MKKQTNALAMVGPSEPIATPSVVYTIMHCKEKKLSVDKNNFFKILLHLNLPIALITNRFWANRNGFFKWSVSKNWMHSNIKTRKYL